APHWTRLMSKGVVMTLLLGKMRAPVAVLFCRLAGAKATETYRIHKTESDFSFRVAIILSKVHIPKKSPRGIASRAEARLALLLFGVLQPHHPGGETVAGMADWLTEIIFVFVNDHRPANNRIGPVQADHRIRHVDLGFAVFIGDDVAQVADMAFFIRGPAVLLVGGIEVAAGRHSLGIGEIAEFMDVEPVFAFLEAGDLALDCHLVA